MNMKLIAIASACVATATLASAAEAGGGVRLGFGFPLGTFTATPAPGGGGGGSYRAVKPRRVAPVQHAARKPDKPAHVVRAQPAKVTSPKAESEKTESVTNGTADDTTESADTRTSVTGSTALIQHSISAQNTDNKTTAAPTAEVKAETKPADTSSTVTSTANASEHCKKFIPAIGMTVSVGCDE